MDYIWTVEVIDGAAFDDVIVRFAAESEAKANCLGTVCRDGQRAARREKGETDEAFIEAIEYRVRRLVFYPG